MKALFTADWHLNLRQKSVPRLWARTRYYELFSCIDKTDCDLHIIGGDIFDKYPTLEELNLFLEFLRETPHETYMFSGNHEATKKNETFFIWLIDLVKDVNKNCRLFLTPTTRRGMHFLPYEWLHTPDPLSHFSQNDYPLFTHVRGNIPPHVKSEVDMGIFERFESVYAGDLHDFKFSQGNVVYPGPPMAIHFQKEFREYGGLLIDTEGSFYERVIWDLPQLIRKVVSSVSEVKENDTKHKIVYSIKATVDELRNVEFDDLITEKIVEREESPFMDFSDLTQDEELREYLLKVSKPENLDQVIKVYNDNIGKINME